MSLINTRMQNLRSGSKLDKNEIRPSSYGALDLFMNQTNDSSGILTPELIEKAKVSIGRTLETPVINFDGDITIGNVRSLVISGAENTSVMHQINFATYVWGFAVTPALHMNNEISLQADFETKFKKYLYRFGDMLDSAAVVALSTNKTQVLKEVLDYTSAGSVLGATWDQRADIIGDLGPISRANDFFREMHLLGNGGLESIIGKLAQRGLYNSENKQLEYSDKILHFSSRVTNEADKFATFFAVEGGSLGILTRFDREALLGTTMQNGRSWGIDTLPMLNFPIGTYFYEDAVDASGIAGAASADMTMARREYYGFSVDVAFMTPYNSDPTRIANPIIKCEIAKKVAAV